MTNANVPHYLGCALVLLLAAGCGGAAIPQGELTQAKSAVSAAEAKDASQHPEAALHLKMAKDQIAQAEQLIANEDNLEARMALERAQKDAELALEKTREAEAEREAEQALKKVRALQSRMERE